MIKLIKSTFYNEKQTKNELINFVKKADQLSFGKECDEFEKKFARYQGRKHCIFLNSGSSANLAIIQALLNMGKIKKGDLIGFSALTWSTNAMPLIQLGLSAVPIDVELDTLNVSSRKLLGTLKQSPIKMLFLTNVLGFCDDLDEIKNICKKRKIIFVEDNCESLGTVYRKRKLGNFGLASTFSFYVGHHMSTIEGGAVCTDNEELANMLRIVRAHGWDRNLSIQRQRKMRAKFKVNSTFYSRYTFYDLGFNLRPTEIAGFLGNTQLKYLDEIIEKREKNFLSMASVIYKNRNKYFPIRYDHIQKISNFAVPIICRTAAIRDNLVKKCENRIEIRPILAGDVTIQPFFRKYMRKYEKTLLNSNARLIHKQGLYFANNPELTVKEMKTMVDVFTS